jgi:hypothetical protein
MYAVFYFGIKDVRSFLLWDQRCKQFFTLGSKMQAVFCFGIKDVSSFSLTLLGPHKGLMMTLQGRNM